MISGIQSSGQPSLGNYLGAFLPFVGFQETHNLSVFIADHHAITVRQDPVALRENSYGIAAWYMASGLDPKKCTLFVQSHVPEHAELGWILSTFTQMGELERMTQYKDKAARHAQNINAGLFTYPSLMAADILLYDAQAVPVGDDQRQHLELTRDIATRVNGVYGEDTLIVPEAVIPKAAARVKDLQEPTKKMSKSSESLGTLFLLDDAKTMEKKLKKAMTDALKNVAYDVTNQPGLANLLEIYTTLKGVSIESAVSEFAGHQYGPLKKAVVEAVLEGILPVQAEYKRLMSDKAELDNILARGAVTAQETASQTLMRVKERVGYVLPR